MKKRLPARAAHPLRRLFAVCLTACLCLPLCIGPVSVLPASATHAEDYMAPAYLVDFTKLDNVVACTGAYHLTPEWGEDGMHIRFEDNGGGMCEDPYLSLALPGGVDATKYPYMAMLVKTDLQNLRGELRFRTDTTGNDYPCQFFNYEKQDEWQLVVVHITNRSTVYYAGAATRFEGNYTNLRLDMFHNNCPSDTEYVIKAYGFYATQEEAETFVHFTSAPDEEDDVLPDVDYAAFWRGEAFASPALSTRMRWVAYGFESTNRTPVDHFLKQGFGGIVSNVLFEKNYLLNDQQFETLGSVYGYANQQGMSTWIYDEYQWPSGKAFGQVLDGHDEYQATGIEHHILNGKGEGVARYDCGENDIRILRVDMEDENGRRTLTEADGVAERSVAAQASGQWTLHVYVLRYTYEGVEDRNDFTTLRHVDLLNKDAVARFIELTHERYQDKMGESFADVDAFFTDEPQLGNRAKTGYAVWTAGLDERFRETYGYELNIAHLFEGDGVEERRSRLQYYTLVSRLFKEAYIDQISAWCEENGTASSGHLLFEECMTDQVETYGGDFMQIVGGMTIPGVDLLWVDPGHLLSKNHIGNAVGTRYVVSAAKNAGKDRVMVEYNPDAANTLSETDPLSECIAGVTITRLLGTTDYNVINPQLNLTTAGYQSLNRYVGRLNTLLEGAQECGELAVFYPIATVQALCNADEGHTSETGQNSEAFALDTKFQTLCTDLLKEQYLYTVLDDVALQNATVMSDGCLSVGNGSYTTIILPMTRYISAAAMETLVDFRAAGGTVIFVGDTPCYGLVAEDDDRVSAAMEILSDAPAYRTGDKRLYRDLASYVGRRMDMQVEDGDIVLMGDFAVNGREITYLANTMATAVPCTVAFSDGYTGEVTVYYPRSGEIRTLQADSGMNLSLPAYEAVLIVREETAYVDHLSAHTPYAADETETESFTETESESATGIADESVETPDEGVSTGTGCASLLGGTAFTATVTVAGIACLLRKRRKD